MYYTTYRFTDHDPVIDEIERIKHRKKLTNAYISTKSGVTTGTLRNWFTGKTKKPQHPTVRAVLKAMNCDYRIVDLDRRK